MTNDEVYKFIEEAFEENYELLRLDGGHAITEYVKRMALEQVKMYWRKLSGIAKNVSETEVKLSLPNQESPRGNKYTIQGVVDVVEEQHEIKMYDIKTHDADHVVDNIGDYEGQLNVYSYIWQVLRGKKLDSAAIIATGQTEELKRALQLKDKKRIEHAFNLWEPVIPIHLKQDDIDGTIYSFGEIIDKIEANEYSPPGVEKLKSTVQTGKGKTFGNHVCRNCDARFSCEPYREYVLTSSGNRRDYNFYLDDYGNQYEKSEYFDSNLEDE